MLTIIPFATFVAIMTLSWIVFRAVAQDYRTNHKLTSRSSFLETSIFFVHGCSSYVYLDSELSAIRPNSLSFVLAATLIILGLVAVYFSMSRLGLSVSIGQNVQGLRKTGLYRFSRNPQIVAYFFVVVGYSLLWPALLGGLWVCLYLLMAHMMVRTEEKHLTMLYGVKYRQYCSHTPKYIGITKQP
jgi:protein-S-isoprenylcysteine O-methyltransferase Ste14